MSDEWELFAGRLKELRAEKGMTQAALADAAELTRDGIAQLESGRRKPAWKTVVRLAQALDVPCEEFRKKAGAKK